MRQVFIICYLLLLVNNLFAQEEVTFKGNKFTLSKSDTAVVIDPVTATEQTQVIPPRPITMNGMPVYATDALKELPFFKSKFGEPEKLSVYLFNELKPNLDSLNDGNYIISINNSVVDKKGKLVYYEFGGIKKLITKTVFATAMPGKSTKEMKAEVDSVIKDTAISMDRSANGGSGFVNIAVMPSTGEVYSTDKAFSRIETSETDTGIDLPLMHSINSKVQMLLEELPKMRPAQLHGEPVNCTGLIFSSWNYIIVKDHKAIFTPFYDGL